MLTAEFYKIFYQNETLFVRQEGDGQPVTQPADTLAATVQPTAEALPPALAYPYQILVLVDNPGKENLDASEGVLLYKILKSVGYDSEDTDILNVGYLREEELQRVLLTKKAHYVISFGVPMKKLGLDLLLTPYAPVKKDGICFVLADPLSVVEADVNIKKRLWNALKVMFPVV